MVSEKAAPALSNRRREASRNMGIMPVGEIRLVLIFLRLSPVWQIAPKIVFHQQRKQAESDDARKRRCSNAVAEFFNIQHAPLCARVSPWQINKEMQTVLPPLRCFILSKQFRWIAGLSCLKLFFLGYLLCCVFVDVPSLALRSWELERGSRDFCALVEIYAAAFCHHFLEIQIYS